MQERYLGDSHDFIKFALLRHLTRELEVRLGVNWYLTRPEQVDRPANNDGGKRHHLTGRGWQEIDADLYERLARLDDPELRQLESVSALGILPQNTIYHASEVPVGERADWQGRALETLAAAELVFLDPDNGFEVPSQSRRTAPKYAFYHEAADHYGAGKIVVSIQFARQCDPVRRAREVRSKLASILDAPDLLPVVRARVAPNILFVTAAPAEKRKATAAAIEGFVQACSKVELIA